MFRFLINKQKHVNDCKENLSHKEPEKKMEPILFYMMLDSGIISYLLLEA